MFRGLFDYRYDDNVGYYPHPFRGILKESLILRQIAVQSLTLEDRDLRYCVAFAEHVAQETDLTLKQEIFNYVEHRIDNYRPPEDPTMLMWYEFSQAFAPLREDPIIGSRSTRLYDYTYTKWQADYNLALAKFSNAGSYACDYGLYTYESGLCGDERSLPIMEIMVEHNESNRDYYDDNSAGGPPRYTYGYYYGAEDALKAILQRVNNMSHTEDESPSIVEQIEQSAVPSIDPAVMRLCKQAAEEHWAVLDLSSKKLIKIPEEIAKLKHLTSLNLSHNQIIEIPDTIGKLTNLTSLSLSGNKIIEIQAAISELKNLTYLRLSDNKITKIPVAISELKNLIYLYLDENKITEIPIEIGELKNLTHLCLHDNKIAIIPQWLQSSKNLKMLTVTGGDNGVDRNMDISSCRFIEIYPPEEENMWFR